MSECARKCLVTKSILIFSAEKDIFKNLLVWFIISLTKEIHFTCAGQSPPIPAYTPADNSPSPPPTICKCTRLSSAAASRVQPSVSVCWRSIRLPVAGTVRGRLGELSAGVSTGIGGIWRAQADEAFSPNLIIHFVSYSKSVVYFFC